MKAQPGPRLLLTALLLAGGCRLPATRTVAIETGQQCWSQVHLVCRIDPPPSLSPQPGWSLWRFPLIPKQSPADRKLQVELIYPHPEKGPQWALALLHQGPVPAGGTNPHALHASAKGKPKPALAIPREELEQLLLALHQPQRDQSPSQFKRAATAVVCVQGTVDGQALYVPQAPAEPWQTLAGRLQRRGWYYRGSRPALQALVPSQLVRAYRRAQRAELPLPLEPVVPGFKKTAQVFRLPGLK